MEPKKWCQNDQQNTDIAIVMVPFPAQSHLNQFLHLSQHITNYNIPVHYAGATIQIRQVKLRLQGWDPQSLNNIHFHDFEIPAYISPSPEPNTQFPAHLQPLYDAYLHLRQPVCHLLQELSSKFRRIIVIHDVPIASVVQDVKLIPNAEAYSLLPVSAFFMFYDTWKGLTEKPFELDSDVPAMHSIPILEGSMTAEIVEFMKYQYQFMDFQSGRLYNTCRAIEGKYVELLKRLPRNEKMKHFVVGPFHPVEIIKHKSEDQSRHRCLEWLDKQEKDSVIFVSFGSSTTMTKEQNWELAEGLERSGQKFVWVVRNADKGDIFKDEDGGRPELPEGYEERVRSRGLVVRDWAPQLEILGHPSTGGFMSHCGWNSCLESISMGVPIAAWPMHSEQPENAVLVTEVLGIGTMARDWSGRAEVVKSDSVENAVRRLMAAKEGAEMRARAAKLGEEVRGSVVEGGASRRELESFIAHITR